MITESTYAVEISDAALAMLDSHVDFLARVSAGAAIKLMDEMLGDMASLSENPQRFPVYENSFIPLGRYRKMLSAKRSKRQKATAVRRFMRVYCAEYLQN